MAADLRDAPVQAAKLALQVGSAVADGVSFVTEIGEQWTLVGPILTMLKVIRKKVETVKSNREELKALHERCTYITACVVVKCRRVSSEIEVKPLKACVKAIKKFVEDCIRRQESRCAYLCFFAKANTDKNDIEGLKERLKNVEADLSLAGIATVEEKVDSLKIFLEGMVAQHKVFEKRREKAHEELLTNQELIISNQPKPPTKLAEIPVDTPARKAWYVERSEVMKTVSGMLTDEGGPRLVGLVGDSGSGKTTTASEIVRSVRVREAFPDGIVWFSVNEGAKERLGSLMMQLARMVFQDIRSSIGHAPAASDDGADYVKKLMEEGNRGKGSKCLVVADNVWEGVVVSKLLDTGMRVLLSTRDEELVKGAHGEAVPIDQMSKADTKSLLQRAAGLSPGATWPVDGDDLIEMCGRVAMNLAFVGRWSSVRDRRGPSAWSAAAAKIHIELVKVQLNPERDSVEETRTKRRRAILQAGFDYLASGTDDERVQRLYLSLAVMPDGHPFIIKNAAVLLYEGACSAEDEESAMRVVEVLERWGILSSMRGFYRMHDAHSSFARESLGEREYVRKAAVEIWVKSISSLNTLRSMHPSVLKNLWVAVERIGAPGWGETRPYVTALAEMDTSNLLKYMESSTCVATFEEFQGEWQGAHATWSRLLTVQRRELRTDHPQTLFTLGRLVICAERLGHTKEAAEWRSEESKTLPLALDRTRLQLDVSSEDTFVGSGLTGLVTSMMGLTPDNDAETEKLVRRALEIEQDKSQKDELKVADLLFMLGGLTHVAGQLEEAEVFFRRCHGIREPKFGQEHTRMTDTLCHLDMCIQQAGRLEEAEELFRKCLRIEEATLGRGDVHMATTLKHLGSCLREKGDFREAEELLRRSLGIKEANLGPESELDLACTLGELGLCVRKAGRPKEAEESLRRSLDIVEAKLGPNDEQVGQKLTALGACIREAGRLEDAEKLLQRSRTIGEGGYVLSELGACIRDQGAGRLKEAEELLRCSLAIRKSKLKKDDVRVAQTLHELVECVRKAGRLEEAEELMKR